MTDRRGRGKLKEAVALLEAELEDGQRPARELGEIARRQGISYRTLQRARVELGVQDERDGFGGPKLWRLPEPSPYTPSSRGQVGATGRPRQQLRQALAHPVTDRRRRRWFALSATWAVGGTGERIRSRFGLAGLAVWAAYLAACKTAVNEGEIEYVTEDQAWRILLREVPEPIPFGLGEFFAYTGSALHHTRRVRRGGVTVVECLHWGDWNRLSGIERAGAFSVDLARHRVASESSRHGTGSPLGTDCGKPALEKPLQNGTFASGSSERIDAGAKTGQERVESGSKAGRKRVAKTPAKRHKIQTPTETETEKSSGKSPQTSTSTTDPAAPPPVWSEGIQSLVEAESRRNGKSAAVGEKALELDRLEALLTDRDENTRVVLERAAAGVPVGVLRELHHEMEARGSEVRRPSAYAVGALQREARRRAEGAAR